MGYKQAPALAVMAVILLAAAADGQVTGVNVAGILNCPSSGPGLPVGPALPGVKLSVNCTNLLGVTVTVGQGITDANGRFNISVPNLLQALPILNGGLIPCTVGVNLPLNQTVCPILNTATGVLSAATSLVGFVVSGLTGLIANLLAGVFVVGSVTIGA